ncbi:iron-only hydrogenase maturation protein HydG [Natranaerovirga hydrolytica]|uniref:Iron-only hydrogenase maturation protein HydG n=1 Tax=Natranaerovirga hydrolytica TaxID=680378 RepID=A0A4R1MJS6_9FIRM|nr:[FeFe] hydrogenase H-cluster radical SAM maturase HydG [Natranaerovirga hydrolytica]TCK92705.1 iron-only hydrogenase maturation protein HydG [Natranaerovirga hydrolytica]
MFINHNYIQTVLNEAKDASKEAIDQVLEKAQLKKGLTSKEIAILLETTDPEQIREIYHLANAIKSSIYGNRIVIFAPLYISDYCVNNCVYCGYKHNNTFPRKKLSLEEIKEEVSILEKMGHKRLALEAGEDPVNCNIDYILDAIDAVYSTVNHTGEIRRMNVNIAATSVDHYKKLKSANIGTYILFQETYHQPTYELMHPKSIKGDYSYHLYAFDRAMEAGIDDVGGGVLFGLADPKFEVLSLMLHNEHLENTFGVGFHTISVPRLKKADGMTLDQFPHLVSDEQFKKIVAILRIALPYTGIILSTRETPKMRKEVIQYGVSQVSAGSCTGVGGYKESQDQTNIGQFDVSDHRPPIEIISELLKEGHIPSYCTACYRQGRTGDRFMRLAKSGQIQNVCQPNALITLMEYILDYGDDDFYLAHKDLIYNEVEKIKREDIKKLTLNYLEKLKQGQRDLYL